MTCAKHITVVQKFKLFILKTIQSSIGIAFFDCEGQSLYFNAETKNYLKVNMKT
jgi:hypothetical protein